jgi:uncharacterized protein (DUF302 family)
MKQAIAMPIEALRHKDPNFQRANFCSVIRGSQWCPVSDTLLARRRTLPPSKVGTRETADRLTSAVEAKGMTGFARIDHAAGAKQAGLELAPIELFIFGNAKGETPLMQANLVVGIDLPPKALVWRDSSGTVWLTYNDPPWIAGRHGLDMPGRIRGPRRWRPLPGTTGG